MDKDKANDFAMSYPNPEIIYLKEYSSRYFAAEKIPEQLGVALFENYGNQVLVEFPGHPTGNQWRLTSQGWVGYIPLSEELHFALEPKVSLSNLFQMLDYAYRLDIHFIDDLFKCESLDDFYDRLASILGRKIMDRGRKGFHRSYVAYQDSLPYLRERVSLNNLIRAPWKVDLNCEFHEHTADIEDNQILAWTLYSIGRSGMCTSKTLGVIRNSFHELDGYVSIQPFPPNACINRVYHRLNQDYQPLHALCRFFLEQSGPSHLVGDRTMIPFLIDMDRLFELFVAEWLNHHLPEGWRVKVQERVYISAENRLYFQVDLVLVNDLTGLVSCVLDTKYKTPESPSPEDIAQVIAYAETLNCNEAILIYPTKLSHPIDEKPGHIRVRCATFDLSDDLERSGQNLIQEIFSSR
jgi:5-methylcytosine-specific restriction enzyme subunit McrC